MNPLFGRWRLPRRTFLKGLGVSMGLPLLDAMIAPGAYGADAKVVPRKVPVRFAALYMANGVPPKEWTPAAEGPLTLLSPILTPLEKVKADVLVLTEMHNQRANAGGGDGHYFKESAWLTGATITKTTGADVNSNGISVDQLMAEHLGHATKIPSLELATEPTRTGNDNNVQITQLYGGHISWDGAGKPVPKEIQPRLAFDRLFRSSLPTDKTAVAPKPVHLGPADDKGVLDLVVEESTSLKNRLGLVDQRKLDEYLTSVREVEKRLVRSGEPRRIDPAAIQALSPLDVAVRGFKKNGHAEHVRLMLDIMLLAFWTDTSRVATFMFGNSVSGRSFSFLDGVTTGHHDSSHHENKPEKLAQYQKIATWHVQQYAGFLERLKAIKEGPSTLLDNSMILFGSALRDGNAHASGNLPILLAGKGGETIKPGRHIVFKKNTPLCNLYGEILARMGIQVAKFGDSTGTLPQLNGA